MPDFKELLEEFDDPNPTPETPKPEDPGFSLKSIDWKMVNDKASTVSYILSSIGSIINSIQNIAAYSKGVKAGTRALMSMKTRVETAQDLVRPMARPYRAGGARPMPLFRGPGPYESVKEHFSVQVESLTEAADWQKTAVIASAISALLILIGQLLSLITHYPEYKQKIGYLVSGMKKDAEDMKVEAGQ